jgi:hypothetical protein
MRMSIIGACAALLIFVSPAASEVTRHFGIGYDLRWVLCCGKSLSGKPFCLNLMKDDCLTYSGRVVSNCAECQEAPDYTQWPGAEDIADPPQE